MEQYIPKSVLVAEIEWLDALYHTSKDLSGDLFIQGLFCFLDTHKAKEIDLKLIIGWFDHIAQIADNRMTLTGQRMTDAHALDEIKCLAKDSSEFITKHYKAQKGEEVCGLK